MANTYEVGNAPRIVAVFRNNLTGLPYDPVDVYGSFTDPSGNVTTYHYGVDVQLVKDSVGNYHYDITIDEAGAWLYRVYSTGVGAASASGYFLAAAPNAPGSSIMLAVPLP